MKNWLCILALLPLSFSKSEYFVVIASEDSASVATMLRKLEADKSIDQNAYKGALLMKSAGFQSTPFSKLNRFNQGRLILEKEIESYPKNAEYRFLRLIIQENAPGLLFYYSNIAEDAAWVKKHYRELNSEVRSAIVKYSKTSVNLKL
jgi:hypothetical protein